MGQVKRAVFDAQCLANDTAMPSFITAHIRAIIRNTVVASLDSQATQMYFMVTVSGKIGQVSEGVAVVGSLMFEACTRRILDLYPGVV